MEILPEIRNIDPKIIVGISKEMTYAHNITPLLWQRFMPKRNTVANRVNQDLISLSVYPKNFNFEDINQKFNKWAACEVSTIVNLPEDFEVLIIPHGKYAVFQYKGLNTDTSIFRYIFGVWLIQSKYTLDNRPHFEVLGRKYKNNDPESEEEIWIPIKNKK